MNDKNEFTDLENKLRNALAREKQKGLHPEQLNALHKAIEGGGKMPAPKSRPWWQLSLAGSVLATAMIAFIVVNRFPGTEQPLSETAESWSDSSVAQPKNKEEVGAPAGPMENSDREGLGRKSDRTAAKTVIKDSEGTANPVKQAGPRKKSKKLADGSANSKKELQLKTPEIIVQQPAPATPARRKNQWKTPGGQSNSQPDTSVSAESSDDAPIAAKPKPSPPLQKNAGAKSKSADKASKADYDAMTLTEKKAGIGAAAGNEEKSSSGSSAGFGGASLSSQQTDAKFNVRIAAMETTGNSQTAKSVIQGNLNQLRRCYEIFEQKTPDPSGPRKGTMQITWVISKSGNVTKLKIPSGSTNLFGMRTCVLGSISGWKFPANAAANISITADFNRI